MNGSDKRSSRGVRSLDLWELVCWTYRDQKAHLYLKTPGDWFDWMVDRQDINRELDTNVGVHYDAAMIHAAVIELGYTFAQLIIEHAENGERPEPSTAAPKPYPVPARDEMMLISDRSGWSVIDGRRFSYVVRS